MSEQLENLLFRYKNKMFLRDDYGVEAVLLFNEEKQKIKEFILKFVYSKLTPKETKEKVIKTPKPEDYQYLNFANIVMINPIKKKPEGYKIELIEKKVTETTFFFSIEKFVIFGLERGYDWEVYGRPQWEAIQPIKKKKFMSTKNKININSNEVKFSVASEIAKSIICMPDRLKQEAYIQHYHQTLGYTIDEFRLIVNNTLKNN